MPAATTHGEGIFLVLRGEVVRAWEERAAHSERLEALRAAFARAGAPIATSTAIRSSGGPETGMSSSTPSPIFGGEIALECGYSSASIRERIYAKRDPDQTGILLYTAATDSEGTLGGVARLSAPRELERILDAAFRSASAAPLTPCAPSTSPSPPRTPSTPRRVTPVSSPQRPPARTATASSTAACWSSSTRPTEQRCRPSSDPGCAEPVGESTSWPVRQLFESAATAGRSLPPAQAERLGRALSEIATPDEAAPVAYLIPSTSFAAAVEHLLTAWRACFQLSPGFSVGGPVAAAAHAHAVARLDRAGRWSWW